MFSKTALAKMIDNSLLRPEVTEEEVARFCEQAREYHFASVVLMPGWLGVGAKVLKGSDVKLASTIGFPFGILPISCKVYEARQAIAMRASELDVMINLGALKSGNLDLVQREIEEMVGLAEVTGPTEHGQEILIKIILEVGHTTKEEQERVCKMAEAASADFIKTCTGFGPRAITVEDIKFLRKVLGSEMGIKASGGIRTLRQAMAMIHAGANRIGTSAGVAIVDAFPEHAQEEMEI